MKIDACAFVLVLMAESASAQLYFCSRPSEPYVPAGYFAEYYEMENAQFEIASYIEEIQEYIECLQREIQDALSEADNLQNEWNYSVSAFNSR